jgi:hypothetical protein
MYGEEAYGSSAYGSAYDVQGGDEDDDCEDVYVEEGVGATISGSVLTRQRDNEEQVEDEDEEEGPLSLLQRFKMPVLNLSMSKPPVVATVAQSSFSAGQSSLMGLLGGYGDDDDEEDEDNNDEEVKEVKQVAPAVVLDVPVEARSVPRPHSVRTAPPPPPPVVQAPSFVWPAMSSGMGMPPVAASNSTSGGGNHSNSSSSGYRRSETAVPASASLSLSREGLPTPAVGLLKGPRIVKTDSAVTALVPNVLKVKRQLQRQQQGLSVKVARMTPVAPLVNAASVTHSALVAGPSSGGSLEDAYNSFLSEIGDLGGFDE